MGVSRTVDEVTRIAVDVVRTRSFPVSVVGSAPSCGGSNYVEIFLRVDGNLEARSPMQVGVFRDAGIESLRQQIVKQITSQLTHSS